jgi:type IV secretory pathway TraG/TraD family ATPase VirD4
MLPVSFLHLIIFLSDFSFYAHLFFSLIRLIIFKKCYCLYLSLNYFSADQVKDYLKNFEDHFINFNILLYATQIVYKHLSFVNLFLTFVLFSLLEDDLNEHSFLLYQQHLKILIILKFLYQLNFLLVVLVL